MCSSDLWIEPKPAPDPKPDPEAKSEQQADGDWLPTATDRITPIGEPEGNGEDGQAVVEALAEFMRARSAQPILDEAQVRKIARATVIETMEEFVDVASEALAAMQGVKQ